jgi:hypothetical protein
LPHASYAAANAHKSMLFCTSASAPTSTRGEACKKTCESNTLRKKLEFFQKNSKRFVLVFGKYFENHNNWCGGLKKRTALVKKSLKQSARS